jgi:hypothetical protein
MGLHPKPETLVPKVEQPFDIFHFEARVLQDEIATWLSTFAITFAKLAATLP